MFWNNFISLCNARNVSPNNVCAQLGFSSAVATKWKNGAAPRDTTLQKIADYFQVPLESLLDDGPNEQQKESSSLTDERVKIAMEHINGLSKEELDVLIPLLEQMKKAKKGTD